MNPVRTQQAHITKITIEFSIYRQPLTNQCKFSEVLTG